MCRLRRYALLARSLAQDYRFRRRLMTVITDSRTVGSALGRQLIRTPVRHTTRHLTINLKVLRPVPII